MEDGAKYLIHAKLTADGVVERSDVVGAVFGQTEGLLGDDLALSDLQEASKVGRIGVDVETEGGHSFADVTIASDLDRVETAILAASLETIDRVGPCLATVAVERIEDVRSAKRRQVVDRAKELLATAFDEGSLDSQAIVEEVRESLRVADLAEYEGLPAGPNVADSDAVIVVEGRADVARLLRFGVKNAIAVEGTNVPDAVAELTRGRTVTAFLDADRGGDLILEELRQVGEVDFVARPPEGKSVEDCSRSEVFAALQGKGPIPVREGESEAFAATDGSSRPAPPVDGSDADSARPDAKSEAGEDPEPTDTTPAGPTESRVGLATADPVTEEHVPEGTEHVADTAHSEPTAESERAGPAGDDATQSTVESGPEEVGPSQPEPDGQAGDVDSADPSESTSTDPDASTATGTSTPASLREHVAAVVGEGTGQVVALDDEMTEFARADADEAFDVIADAEAVPHAVVLDGELTQRVLDVAAQRGVGQVVARELGSFTKRPVDVRVRTAADF